MIDSHAHLGDAAFDSDRDAVTTRGDLAAIVDICTDLPTLKTGLELAARHPHVHLAAATTPHDVEADGEAFFPHVEAHLDQLVAIGETGLDYHYEHSPRALQQQFLRRYLALASRAQLPIIIHCRDAFSDLYRIFDEENYSGAGVMHCFTGTLPEAQEAIERGFLVSFSGILTFKKSVELREVAQTLPLSSLLVETDAPYLAPQSVRGQRNEPAHVAETVESLATLHNLSPAQMAEQTASNACQLFSFS